MCEMQHNEQINFGLKQAICIAILRKFRVVHF